ncbi:hypothetical protein DJ010_16925 [Nocardioides silvaticus]|uniref:Uncharacterized protein n=1 Tax=Nocardioides silvaticus TaxID=2201891 RepID=A0A316TD57_9ACTN|nr:hypothetical protein [Nocardioides silvaticus]PWN01718.1 hypothetical protein DJ010_16925 [Nocardioides silvaticus]
MADKPTREDSSRSSALTVARVRGTVARVVWVVCLTLALILAIAAFSFALDANEENGLVQLVRDLADAFDLRAFDLEKPVKEFDDPNSEVKTALFNYGIAAVVYMIVGRFLERLIRP